MFYNFIKLSITKEIKDMDSPKCIIISQEALDFPIIDMINSKGVKVVINCVDKIIKNEYCEEYISKRFKVYYIPKDKFNIFKDMGVVFISISSLAYNDKIINFINPQITSMNVKINDFIDNTIDYMLKEKNLINKVSIYGIVKQPKESVLIISRGFYKADSFSKAKSIISKFNPTIIAVDGGFDIALKNGIVPHIVIGDMDSINNRTLNKCEYFILHCYINGNCPGKKWIPLNKKIGYIKCFGTSEDAAILYSTYYKVKRIFTLGYHISSYDFIEKGRRGMSSSILINLKYGNIIKNVDAAYTYKRSYAVSIFGAFMIVIALSLYLTKLMGVLR